MIDLIEGVGQTGESVMIEGLTNAGSGLPDPVLTGTGGRHVFLTGDLNQKVSDSICRKFIILYLQFLIG